MKKTTNLFSTLRGTDCNPIPLVDITGMDEKTWLNIREHGVGYENPLSEEYIPVTVTGSGASSALGVNPWVSDVEYQNSKMGIETALKTTFNEESKAAGHIFEPFVAINFTRWMHANEPEKKIELYKDVMRDVLPYLKPFCPTDKDFKAYTDTQDELVRGFNESWEINPSYMYQCGICDERGALKYPFALANIDGLVKEDGKMGIFEAKTTSPRSKSVNTYWTQGKVPPYYYWQVVFYMAVMNVDFGYITCIWGCTLNDMAVIRIDRDLAIEEQFMNYLKEFVDMTEMGIALEESKSDPEILNQYYFREFGAADITTGVELPSKCQKVIEYAITIDEKVKTLEEEIESLRKEKEKVYSKLYPIMGKHSYGSYTDTKTGKVYGVKIKTPMHKAKFDEDSFKEAYPDVYAEFCKPKFDTTEFGKKNRKLKAEYTLPAEPKADGHPSFEIFIH